MNIILDLDETLINANPMTDFNVKDYEKRFLPKLDELSDKDVIEPFERHNMDDYYMVFERPHLQKFLDYLFSNFRVSVWTAASQSYALFIIEKIILADKPLRHLDYIFFSYHCGVSKKFAKKSKALHIFWDKYNLSGYNAENTLIIDDNKEVYETQPKNCIIAKEFTIDNDDADKDVFLIELIPKLQHVKNQGVITDTTTEKINTVVVDKR